MLSPFDWISITITGGGVLSAAVAVVLLAACTRPSTLRPVDYQPRRRATLLPTCAPAGGGVPRVPALRGPEALPIVLDETAVDGIPPIVVDGPRSGLCRVPSGLPLRRIVDCSMCMDGARLPAGRVCVGCHLPAGVAS